MIDIHAHIIPHVDDGSDRMSTSLRMAEMAAKSGITDLIATPHSNQRGRYENYASDALKGLFQTLKSLLRREEIPLRLHLGMEIFATSDMLSLMADGKLLTLAESRYLLLEFGFYDSTEYMTHILREVQSAGYVPIVAHPERYYALQAVPNHIFEWVEGGVHLQLNKGSLSGAFGRDAFELAMRMLDHDLVSFCASDAHGADRRTTVLSEAYRWLSVHYSENRAERLLRKNPEQVLSDRPLYPCRPVPFR